MEKRQCTEMEETSGVEEINYFDDEVEESSSGDEEMCLSSDMDSDSD